MKSIQSKLFRKYCPKCHKPLICICEVSRKGGKSRAQKCSKARLSEIGKIGQKARMEALKLRKLN